ncbi:hypothetical protein [Sulfurovum sp. NBC37-1]|uniref:hypothetical protein n=1 Tax=Sulfurovum sp. (strain NBC37-1) TaxID=387093 RepID=UPI0002D5F2C8|nr:hypothetical protein [Sulfurovum sp. NBC37-1]
MRSDFRPVQTVEAKKRLSSYLNEAERKLTTEKEYYREMRKRRSVWQKLLGLFR